MNCPKCKKKMRVFGVADLRLMIGRFDTYLACDQGCTGKDGFKLEIIKSVEMAF